MWKCAFRASANSSSSYSIRICYIDVKTFETEGIAWVPSLDPNDATYRRHRLPSTVPGARASLSVTPSSRTKSMIRAALILTHTTRWAKFQACFPLVPFVSTSTCGYLYQTGARHCSKLLLSYSKIYRGVTCLIRLSLPRART